MDKIKILVVDDESRMRKLVRDFLVRQDYEVFEAGDGEEALDLFYEEKGISVILLDVMMPRLNGWEVVKEIRQTSKVPIIMLTAKADEADELLGFELGVDEYISKPFSPKILVARVEAILRRTNKIGDAANIKTAGGITIDKTSHTVTIGDVGFAYAPYEMFDTNGKQIKEGSPFAMTFVCTMANIGNGYVAEEAAYEYGGYEVEYRGYLKGTAEELANQFVSMLKELKGTEK